MGLDMHLLYFTKLSGKSVDFYFLVGTHLKYIGIHCLQFCVNIPSNFEGFSGIATVEKCDKYIMFSHDFVVDTMRELGAKSFNPMKFSFEPKKFCSLGITLIRNLFKWIEKHIIFHLKTKNFSIIKIPEYWTIFSKWLLSDIVNGWYLKHHFYKIAEEPMTNSSHLANINIELILSNSINE